ncbi:MAG: histidine kinase [Rhizobiaceae bacterium]
MPSLIRFIVVCGILAGLVYGGMFALATFVEPNQREMSLRVPASKLNK